MRRNLLATVVAGAAVVCSLYGVSQLQPRLASIMHEVKQKEDLYIFPPPDQMKVLALGYDAPLVDLLWAKLLIEYGIHWSEHRPFPDLPRYADAILGIEPDFDALYRYIDTMVVYRPPQGTEDDARLARKYLERGTVARPNDPKVWMALGEFVSYIGPSFLSSEAEKDVWRTDGARVMARAVELGGQADRGISAASLLSRSGERGASVRTLTRLYALTDDPAQREEIASKLQQLAAKDAAERAERAMQLVEGEWRRELPFVRRTMFLLVGPHRDPFACAGGQTAEECSIDWNGRLPDSAPAALE